jgi:ABC-type sugar transport system substrate-binding protein
MRKPLIRALFLLVATIALISGLLVTGCSRKNEVAPWKKVAGMVFQEDQFFRLVLFGMRDAAKANNIELLEANSQGKPDKEIQLINTYIASDVDGIVISPLSAKASLNALKQAKEKNIAVVTYNTTVEGDVPASFIESDQTALGASTGKAARAFIEQRLHGKATIGILTFISQAPEQGNARTTGFKQEVTTLPGVRIVAEQDAWLAEQAVKKAGDILTANPDVNILWAANEGGTVGAVMAVKNAGKAGKVFVFGTDTGEQIADFLLANDQVLQAVTGQRPYDIGKLAVETMVRVLKKEPVQPKISLSGVLLSRDHPDEVRSFREHLRAMSQ